MHSFVFYRLVNGNAPLSVLISIAVVSLQLFQNAAARILTITTKFTPWPLFTGYPGRPELSLRFLFELIRPSVMSFPSSGHHIWWPSLFPRHWWSLCPLPSTKKGLASENLPSVRLISALAFHYIYLKTKNSGRSHFQTSLTSMLKKIHELLFFTQNIL